MDKLMLDGNAIAGLLQEVFAVEMTTAIGTCGGCGAAGPVGAAHVYRGRASCSAAHTATTCSPRSSRMIHGSGSTSRESALWKSPSSRLTAFRDCPLWTVCRRKTVDDADSQQPTIASSLGCGGARAHVIYGPRRWVSSVLVSAGHHCAFDPSPHSQETWR